MSNLKHHKLSWRTQMALAQLLADIKSASADVEPDGVATWSGEFVLWYDDNQRQPLLAVYMDHSAPGSGFGQWWTNVNGQLTADEDLAFLMRG